MFYFDCIFWNSRRDVRIRVDAFAIVAIAFLGFLFYNALADWGASGLAADKPSEWSVQSADEVATPLATGGGLAAPTEAPPEIDVDTLRYPYDTFTLTQGPHGMSYGHMAIDLTGGKGATIYSPLNGVVTQLYIDEYGNPTLVIENAHYQVILMHGVYTVKVGENITIGQPVGT